MNKVQVSKDAFFAHINPLDVHPTPRGRYDHERRDYHTDWKLRDGRVVGYSFAGDYWLINSTLPVDSVPQQGRHVLDE